MNPRSKHDRFYWVVENSGGLVCKRYTEREIDGDLTMF